MRVIQIKNSYKVWRREDMQTIICNAMQEAGININIFDPFSTTAEDYLNRSYRSMYIEWWMHNIGYCISLPLKKWKFWREINQRCKDVDLEEWV